MGKYVLRRGELGLELWTEGSFSTFCGYVSNAENMGTAIDEFEEEIRYLVEDALAEFKNA
jgi:hypothetical protein